MHGFSPAARSLSCAWAAIYEPKTNIFAWLSSAVMIFIAS
jgi:hypothetical protein